MRIKNKYDDIIDKFNKCSEKSDGITLFLNDCASKELDSFNRILNKLYNELIILIQNNEYLKEILINYDNLEKDIIKSQNSWEEYTDTFYSIIMSSYGSFLI